MLGSWSDFVADGQPGILLMRSLGLVFFFFFFFFFFLVVGQLHECEICSEFPCLDKVRQEYGMVGEVEDVGFLRSM